MAYFPGELWYDYFTRAPLTNGKPVWLTLSAPLDTIPVHINPQNLFVLDSSMM